MDYVVAAQPADSRCRVLALFQCVENSGVGLEAAASDCEPTFWDLDVIQAVIQQGGGQPWSE